MSKEEIIQQLSIDESQYDKLKYIYVAGFNTIVMREECFNEECLNRHLSRLIALVPNCDYNSIKSLFVRDVLRE